MRIAVVIFHTEYASGLCFTQLVALTPLCLYSFMLSAITWQHSCMINNIYFMCLIIIFWFFADGGVGKDEYVRG